MDLISSSLETSSQALNELKRDKRSLIIPWIITWVALYVFALPWMGVVIVDRYWIRRDWNAVLTGLDTTAATRFFMLGHMTFGGVAVLLGPWQFVPYIRRKFRRFHHWNGRIFLLCAFLNSTFGVIFILLKRFILVGGYNMGVAFSTAGVCTAFFSVQAYRKAIQREWPSHFAYVTHTMAQMIAPVLYRYWYRLLVALGWYPDVDITCNAETGICPVYLHVFDRIHAWTFFLVPMMIAQVIIYVSPKQDYDSSAERDVGFTIDEGTTAVDEEGGLDCRQALLADDKIDPLQSDYASLEEEKIPTEKKVADISGSIVENQVADEALESFLSSDDPAGVPDRPSSTNCGESSMSALNAVAISLAVLTVVQTTILFISPG